jgi:hypothetical protein
MHRNHPSVFWSAILSAKSPLGTAIFQKLNATNQSNKLYPMPVEKKCNVHGHHNRNHRIIIPLNTRILGQLQLVTRITPWVRQPIAKNPD